MIVLLFFQIPDAEQAYSKEEIMDYFFLTVSPTLSEIYPCYYKVSFKHMINYFYDNFNTFCSSLMENISFWYANVLIKSNTW